MILRAALLADARGMAELLNDIIAIGGTTAMTTPLSRGDMEGWIVSNKGKSVWSLAEDDAGTVLGFQAVGPSDELPEAACDIATFTRTGRAQMGIGSRLFERTVPRARALGYGWINATVRSVNTGGLIYYKSRGFEPYRHEPERLFLRFDLR